ncbi:uncharacterized protein KY384_007856 [Bacidia gigantensis]|uniref:uncharacterized protein n=1 Tax=Bacidia gigantensis TaxID=2732470 RepID=UPI001D038965|nr:uncharacterized protein KY384_007856 [Bacidia gigantensis]KAG8527702.1 hypothetical protein KY384_007856 [Bacidia gigantensis]
MTGSRDDERLERSASQLSTASRRSGTVRAPSRKQSLVTPASAKTLESFPSLSPEVSPAAKRASLPPDPSASVNDPPKESPGLPSRKDLSMVANLVHRTSSMQGRTALFEESRSIEAKGVPGTLHHASDEHIQRLVKKTGAVALVRQLAADVAHRDAELTLLRRHAEERERELKKMLREVEVSNLDIEKRLHRIDHKEEGIAPGSHTEGSAKNKPPVAKGNGKPTEGARGIDEMMGEAMDDDVRRLEIDEGYLDSVTDNDKQATVKAKGGPSRESDGQSVASSIDSQGQPRGTLRGWKGYLWGGTGRSRKTSKASSVVSEQEQNREAGGRTRGSSGNSTRRKGLNEDTFQPLTKASTVDNGAPQDQSRKSSVSVTSWTTKLFAGNPAGSKEAENQGTVRNRSNTTGSENARGSRSGSTASGPPPRSAKAALMRVSSMENGRLSKKSVSNLQLGQKGNPKTQIPPVPPLPSSPARAEASTNLGPVEMDTIHPYDSKPPTLVQNGDKTSDDLLTDRFGFIYDQRRRKKEAEASISHKRGKSTASANVEMINSSRASMKSPGPEQRSQLSVPDPLQRSMSPNSNDEASEERPAKRWQDYLKVSTTPTELLIHTPSAKPGINVINADTSTSPIKRLPTQSDLRKSGPPVSTNAEPEMSPVTAGKAEITRQTSSKNPGHVASAVVEEEPVKLLLAQLTELHDALQREKTVRWNEFLRKVRAERKKEGELAAATDGRSQQAAMPEMMLTDGEVIGMSGLGNKGKVGRAKWKEFKQLVLGGVPVSYRAKTWAECSGAAALRVPGYYDELIRTGIDDPAVISQIQMDIRRTLTDNVFFRKGPGVAKLNEVLVAYSRRNPDVGYCQGMNLIAASLLLVMPTAEDAFWVLTSLIENILPQHYYDPSLLASRADQQVLRAYVSELLPRLSSHLDDLGIELDALTFQWFLSVFTDCLSAEALFRVWDVIFCFNDGSTFLFQVAVALLKLNESQLLECDSAARVYGYIGNEMTDHAISIDGLVSASDALRNVITRREVEERRWKAVEEARGREKSGRASRSGSSATSAAELSMQEPRPFEDNGNVNIGGKA